MKTRNFIVKIYKKPLVYKIKAKNKKETKSKALSEIYMGKEENIHEIKVVNDTNPKFSQHS